MDKVIKQFETVIHSEIPLSQAMGVSVTSYDGQSLTLTAPLEKNTNHKSTAFGGSLYSIAVLTGWGWIYLKLHEAKLTGHIVIQKSEINHFLPVTGDIVAQCQVGDPNILNKFIHTYRKKNRSRIHLDVNILQGNECAVQFRGSYVIHK
jgi:thioesterase domain-containing protein